MQQALGILGGMGPQATVDFMQKVILMTAAEWDQQHLRIYVDCHPQIPDRISAILTQAVNPRPAMLESLHKLEACGAGVIAMPCLTAHYFLPDLRREATAEFIDMLEVTALACKKRFPGQTAGVLSSVATAESGLFTQVLERMEIPFMKPQHEHQLELGKLILRVKAQEDLSPVADRLSAIAAEMRGRGADYFVLACTELPLITQYRPLDYPCVDVTTELVKAAILACGYPLKPDVE